MNVRLAGELARSYAASSVGESSDEVLEDSAVFGFGCKCNGSGTEPLRSARGVLLRDRVKYATMPGHPLSLSRRRGEPDRLCVVRRCKRDEQGNRNHGPRVGAVSSHPDILGWPRSDWRSGRNKRPWDRRSDRRVGRAWMLKAEAAANES